MSYAQAMRWQHRHPRGLPPQYMGFASFSGFTPSVAFIAQSWTPYVEACAGLGVAPLPMERFYNRTLRGRVMSCQDAATRAEYTRLMRARAAAEPANGELEDFRHVA